MGRWSKRRFLIGMALAVHAKVIRKSEIVETEQQYGTHLNERDLLQYHPFPRVAWVFERIVKSERLERTYGHVTRGYLTTFTYVNESSLLSKTLIINDMKRIEKEVSDSKKPSMGSIHGPGPETSTSTLVTSTTDFLPSIPAEDSDATTASTQVTTGVSVSVQRCQSHL